MAILTDREYMAEALDLAVRARGKTSPNPMVGAVIVKGKRVVGRGYHRRAGADHAEIVALKDAGKAAKGATLYVTLEPCCHTGRTGPCTESIKAAGIARVVLALKDPNPRVNGRGARALRQAGIEVSSGILRRQAEQLNEIYLHAQRTGLPFVTLKLAQTLDGRIAASNGSSRWITGAPARKLVHWMRREHDAIAVGMGTVRADNPSLDVRHVPGRDPYRIVVSSSLRFPESVKVIDGNTDFRTIVAGPQNAVRRFSATAAGRKVTCWTVRKAGNGQIDLGDLLEQASRFGLQSILFEGGARLATSLLRERLVDKLVLFVAPRLLGNGIPSIGDLGITSLADTIEFDRVTAQECGSDLMLIGYPIKTGGK